MARKFENYKILAEIGRGGMGMVYKALDERTNKTVAIKQLILENIDEGKHKEFRDRFRREAQTVSRLQHKNIVTVFEISQDPDSYHYVMEFLEGHSLRKEINRQGGKCSLSSFYAILSQAAEGLSYAHSMNIIHRDVKPDNIFILNDGTVKITDFGIARVADLEATNLTKTGIMLGTLAYVSPEQLQNAKLVDHRADIFSLGVVAYEALCGDLPFTGDGIAATIVKIMSTEETPLHIVNPQISPEVSGTVSRALRKRPRDRYRSVNEFIRDFKQCIGSIADLPDAGIAELVGGYNPHEARGDAASSSMLDTSTDLLHEIEMEEGWSETEEEWSAGTVSGADRITLKPGKAGIGSASSEQPTSVGLGTTGGAATNSDCNSAADADADADADTPPKEDLSNAQADSTVASAELADYAVRLSLDKEGVLDERARARLSSSGKHKPLTGGAISGPLRLNPPDAAKPRPKEAAKAPSEEQITGEIVMPQSASAATPGGVAGRMVKSDSPFIQSTYNPIKYSGSIRAQGSKERPFSEPAAICYRSGRLLVSDTAVRAVHMFSRDGRWLCDLTHRPDAPDTKTGGGRFTKPSGIAIDERSRIYVCDSSDHFIRVFDGQGSFIKEFRNIQGKDGGLAGIAIDTTGLLYLSDSSNGCLQVFQSDVGIWVRSIATKGTEPGQLQLPAGLATDRVNRVYVADYGTSRVSIFNKAGGLVRSFGQKGNQRGMFNVPRALAVDKHDRIFVLDSLNHRIQVFGQAGDWLYTFGSLGNGNDEFCGPSGISIDNENSILFIADKGNKRIQIFELGFK